MKNPFTLLTRKIGDLFQNRKQSQVVKKQKGTKVETARSKSGGGKSADVKVSNDEKQAAISSRTSKTAATKKRRIRNKMRRKSRRINRLHRQFHKAA